MAISRVPMVGPVLAKNLIAYCGDARTVFSERQSALEKIPGVGIGVAQSIRRFNDFKRIEDEVAFMTSNNIKGCFFTDPDYPYRLKHIPDAPVMLFVKGQPPDQERPALAIIGTRKCSRFAKEKVDELIEGLRLFKPLVVSGLAYGVDAEAHKAAVDHELQTYGVLGHGLGRIYPGQHANLAAKMIESGGGLITEFMHDVLPDKENFPKRNRIVAGMVDAVLVVETPLKGGSMITAQLAFGYDREVMALPVRAGDQYYGGTNALIKRNQAHLVESAEDIANVLNWDLSVSPKQGQMQLSIDLKPEEQRIFDALKEEDSLHIEMLCDKTRLSPGKLSIVLLEMEFNNIVRSLPGKRYELV